jgi:hypothetical protein
MKVKTLVVLLGVAAVLGLAAMWSRRSGEEPSDRIGRAVLGGLQVNDIARMVIATSSSTSCLAKADGVWVSESQYGYPADFARIKSAIVKVAEMKVGQVVDAEPGDKAAMKMVAPAAGADGGTLVEMLDKSGTLLGSLLIGAARQRAAGDEMSRFGGYPDGQFVSADRGESVVLVKDNLYEFDRADDWLEKELVSVPGADVVSVRIGGPERAAVELTTAEGATDLTLAGLGEKEEMDRSRVNGITSALSYLRFESVADPALSDEATGLGAPTEFVVTTKAGEIYTVQIGNKAADSENRYARIRVALAPAAPEPEATPEAEQTEEEQQAAAAEKASRAEARAALETKVADLNAKLGPWTYVLASYKSDTMISTREQVVKAVEDEKPEDGVPDQD